MQKYDFLPKYKKFLYFCLSKHPSIYEAYSFFRTDNYVDR